MGKETLQKVEDEADAHLAGFSSDLKTATTALYEKLAADKTAQANVIAGLTGSLDTAMAASAAELKEAKELFASRELTLTNAIVANQEWFKGKLEEKTGMILDWKKASDADREAIRATRNAMVMELEAGIENAVAVEAMADNVFASVQGNRQKIADNYLSLKAYA